MLKLSRPSQVHEALQQSLKIRPASALRVHPAARAKRAQQIVEQPLVVEDPMKRSGAEDAVEGIGQGGMLRNEMADVGSHKRDLRAELGFKKLFCDF
jgi:hypothetical protein